jgi:hypothetical protein
MGSGLSRRCALMLLGGGLSGRALAAPAPGRVLILRHMATEPGIGDPPGFRLDDCSTQRNLSAQGRDQARAFGERLALAGWQPRAMRSSRWCRCVDSARAIAAGLGSNAPAVQRLDDLNSFFEQRQSEPAQTLRLGKRLRALPAPKTAGDFELWVTHQVNISALTGRATSMGQALWLRPRADGGIEAQPFD